MSAIDLNLRVFDITLRDGTQVELRFPWPAMARVEAWLGGIPWYQWDSASHVHLQAMIAGGMLHTDRTLTPERVAENLSTPRIAEYRTTVDDAIAFAATGKTRAERIAEAEEKRRSGEATAASQTTPTE